MSKIAFVFPGQGAQYVGMGKDLYENNEIAKKYFDEIFENMEIDLKRVMFEGPEEDLKQTKYTQPAIVAMSLVLAKLMEEKGIKADYVAGHSVGEYAALGSGGYLSLEDAVKLTAFRGDTMNTVSQEVNGTMAAIIGMEAAKIEEVLAGVDGVVEAVNFNEPGQTVIAGSVAAIEKACEALKAAGARRALILSVSGPFHSSLMKPAGEKLKAEVENYEFKTGTAKLVANTTAEVTTDAEEIKKELYDQTFGPVRWVETVEKLKSEGVEKIYEIGPGKVLKGLIRKIDKTLVVENIEKLEDLA
ncbi:ACP S-malonyltransferase [Ilyobacter polytropus]|uniref:Malonyl CoA-acyl carrier protein transacylase n=1 Tax=Ilyobacter polytropus (strain ATCC 51220 / DSM 2926 / LMG 16218 / CuHBu1) TaxID=572544 RepID=E3H859_ILYPC|nr:ACP S-malonyltransferase [Ilyobacter polytropus]ADO83290.1 (Acyl-carrier-protein) S-malonyltransferase [Ilyobacter polytropus DSM 2926]